MTKTLAMPEDAEEEIRERYWHVMCGDVVLDVGSFVGNYAVPALAAGAVVYAVDARKHTLTLLRRYAEANGVAERLRTVWAVVYDGGAYPDWLNEAIADCVHHSARDMIPDAHAPATTVDALVADLGLVRLDWLKVDVEGGEPEVLAGGIETLRTFHPQVLVEDHSRVYPAVAATHPGAKMLAFLRALDYDVTVDCDSYPDHIIAR